MRFELGCYFTVCYTYLLYVNYMLIISCTGIVHSNNSMLMHVQWLNNKIHEYSIYKKKIIVFILQL